jgi:hypothetical protein
LPFLCHYLALSPSGYVVVAVHGGKPFWRLQRDGLEVECEEEAEAGTFCGFGSHIRALVRALVTPK